MYIFGDFWSHSRNDMLSCSVRGEMYGVIAALCGHTLVVLLIMQNGERVRILVDPN